MANLSISELAKYSYRLEKVIYKIENNSPFQTVSGDMVIINKSVLPKFLSLKEAGNFLPNTVKNIFGSNVILQTEDNKEIRLTKLKKTAEFGGESTGKRLTKEQAALQQLQTFLKNSGTDKVCLKDKNGRSYFIDKVIDAIKQEKVDGTDQKADFILIRSNNLPSIYISHKSGYRPKDFGQWSGVTIKSGNIIATHPEVISFAEDIKSNSDFVDRKIVDNQIVYTIKSNVGTIAKKISDINLKILGVFGNECLINNKLDKQNDGNPQKVDFVCQGNFSADIVNNTLNLTCEHIIERKSFANIFDDGYEPILVARHMKKRSNQGVGNTRMAIYPESGRNIKHVLPL